MSINSGLCQQLRIYRKYTWTALSSLGLQPGVFLPLFIQVELSQSFVVLHCHICNARRCLDLNPRHIYVLLVLLAHCGHAGRGQACRLAVAAVGGVHLHVAARAGKDSQAGAGGDAAQVGRDARLAARVDPARQAGGAHHRRHDRSAHALNFALQEVGQHLTFTLDTDLAAAHQVVVGVQQAIDLFCYLYYTTQGNMHVNVVT